MISADKAIPLGLLINEIVTNSAKHAYPDGSGEIQVSGERHGADLHVEVSDQGIGLPKDFDIDQLRASLGFKVIKSLLAQLDGRIAVASNTPNGVPSNLMYHWKPAPIEPLGRSGEIAKVRGNAAAKCSRHPQGRRN
jgi:two-component system, sensor histidine kinase PdtaS